MANTTDDLIDGGFQPNLPPQGSRITNNYDTMVSYIPVSTTAWARQEVDANGSPLATKATVSIGKIPANAYIISIAPATIKWQTWDPITGPADVTLKAGDTTTAQVEGFIDYDVDTPVSGAVLFCPLNK